MIWHHLTGQVARRLALGATCTIALAGAVACGGGSDETATATATVAVTATQPANGGGDAGPIAISLVDNLFEPSEITVPVNTEVEITVENKGAAVHNMHVLSMAQEGKDFTSELIVSPGASSTFAVKFTKTGTYDFQCDYHLPDMSGTITVQ